tara:strand:- start:123 stop:437 length:315 start_codon:yes stop_codon:yes gene_type:complete
LTSLSKLKNSPTNVEVSKNGKGAVYLKVKKMGEGRKQPTQKDSRLSINGVDYTHGSIDESTPPVQVGGESVQDTADQYSFMNDEDHYNSNYLKDFKRVQKQGTI